MHNLGDIAVLLGSHKISCKGVSLVRGCHNRVGETQTGSTLHYLESFSSSCCVALPTTYQSWNGFDLLLVWEGDPQYCDKYKNHEQQIFSFMSCFQVIFLGRLFSTVLKDLIIGLWLCYCIVSILMVLPLIVVLFSAAAIQSKLVWIYWGCGTCRIMNPLCTAELWGSLADGRWLLPCVPVRRCPSCNLPLQT